MMMLPAGVKVHIAAGVTDMRKGMDGLAMLVEAVLRADPFSGLRLQAKPSVALPSFTPSKPRSEATHLKNGLPCARPWHDRWSWN